MALSLSGIHNGDFHRCRVLKDDEMTNVLDLFAGASDIASIESDIASIETDMQHKINSWDLASSLALKADVTTTYTKSETDAAVAALVDSAPATLDTLNELAAALGDDADFATSTATLIGTKADAAATTASLATKANAANVYSRTHIDTQLATKADDAATTTALATKADDTATTTALATKADDAATTTALTTKVNTWDLASALALKTDVTASNQHAIDEAAARTTALMSYVQTTTLDSTLESLFRLVHPKWETIPGKLYIADGTQDYATSFDDSERTMTGTRIQTGVFNSGAADFSLSLQFKRTVINGTGYMLDNNFGAGMSRVTIIFNGSNRLQFSVGATNNDTGMTPAVDTWYTAAIVQQGSTTSYYVDGVLDSTSSATLNVGDKVTVSTKNSHSNQWLYKGHIMHIKYYDWALPAWAIASLAAQTSPTS